MALVLEYWRKKHRFREAMVAEQWWSIPPIPRETQRRARAVFSGNNFYLRLGDQLQETLNGFRPGTLIDEAQNWHGPAPVLALVTFFQVVEELSDTQASDALRTRIDWQYALHLPPNGRGLRQDELCAYRNLLIFDPNRRQVFRRLANRLSAMRPFRDVQVGCSGSLDVVTAVCQLNRLKWSVEAIRELLWALANRWPDLLSTIALPHWYTTYWSEQPLFSTCFCCLETEDVDALGRKLGVDAGYLLEAIARWRKVEVLQMSEVRALERIWRQQFEWDAHGTVTLRTRCRYCRPGSVTRAQEGT